MWFSIKTRLINRQIGYRYRRIDPSVRRKSKIRNRILLAFAGLIVYIATIACIDRMVFLLEPEISTSTVFSDQRDDTNPSPLISNAFKLGHGLTQMRYAETNNSQLTKWRNRTSVYMAALGIDNSVIHEAIEDSILTLDETILLRDQIRQMIIERHGVNAASTFLVGVELIPVTRSFELDLHDREYRKQLANNDISILQLGSLLNANLDMAVLPDALKLDLIAVYTRIYRRDATQIKLDQIKRFREGILDHFYGESDEIESS